jgi:hypothetical protein
MNKVRSMAKWCVMPAATDEHWHVRSMRDVRRLVQSVGDSIVARSRDVACEHTTTRP